VEVRDLDGNGRLKGGGEAEVIMCRISEGTSRRGIESERRGLVSLRESKG